MEILLVRHGESLANLDKTILRKVPDHAIGLSPEGQEQAKECGEFLRDWIDNQPVGRHEQWRVWHSPYSRAVNTAQAIYEKLGPRARDIREHILLGEQQFGLFDGIPDEDLPKEFPREFAFYKKHEEFEGRFWTKTPMGESRFDVAQRVHQCFGTFHRDAAAKGVDRIIVVSHGVVMRAFQMMWCHKGVPWIEKAKNPQNCSVIRIAPDGTDSYIFAGFPRKTVPKTGDPDLRLADRTEIA